MSSKIDLLNGHGHRYSLSNNSFLAYRSSGVIAHRLSVYMPRVFPLSKNPQKLILEINSHVTAFRGMLIQMGQAKDNPELRKEIRRCRQLCMEECQQAVQVLMIGEQSVNTTHTSCVGLLFCLLQQFSKELIKSYRLIQVIPLDMSKHNDNRTRSTTFGNVIGQIVLCKEITPDFNQEELCSIENDVRDIEKLMAELKSHMPKTDSSEERHNSIPLQNGSMGLHQADDSKLCESTGLLCCVSRRK